MNEDCKKDSSDDKLSVMSYKKLRRIVGFLGIGLPIVVFIGALIFNDGFIAGSISGYYYTKMGSVFVGVMFITGSFFFVYRAYDCIIDDIAGYLACLFVVGTAIFPTAKEATICCEEQLELFPVPWYETISISHVHFVFATLYFLTLIFFSMYLFTKSNKKKMSNCTPEKRIRNKIYIACGIVMAVCIILLAINFIFISCEYSKEIEWIKPVLVLETVAVWFFAISWLTKGGLIFPDKAKES